MRPPVLSLGRVLAAVVLCGFALAASPAGAAPAEDERAKARDHFEKGRVNYDLKEYEQALKEFKDAYRYFQDPVFLYNIAQCHWKLGHNREAVDFYRNYLRRSPNAPNRADIERRIEELQNQSQPAPPPPEPAPPKPKPAPPKPQAKTTPPPSPTPPPPEPTPPPAPPPATPALDLRASPPPPESAEEPPIYKKWWFWVGVGVVAVGAAGAAFALSNRGEVGDCMGLARCTTISP